MTASPRQNEPGIVTPLRGEEEPGQTAPPPPDSGDAPRGGRRRRWPWLLGVVVLAGLGYALYQNRVAGPETPVVAEAPAERVMRLSALDVTSVRPQHLRETIRISGSLTPGRQAMLAAQTGGRVLSISARPGDPVAEGEIVAEMDTEELLNQIDQQRNAIAATRAQLSLAEAQLGSARTLAEREVGSRATLEGAQSNFDAISANLAAQEGQLRGIQLALSNATITAPFAGILSTRNVEPLQTVGAGTAIATLVDISNMEMQAVAPISSADMLAPGQRAVVDVEGLRGQRLDAEVHRISPVAIEGTRSIQVFINLPNESGVLRGGMFATGEVVVAEREGAIAVPAAAVRTDAEGTHVLVVAGERLERRPVEVADAWNGGRLVEIASGLAEGEVFVSVRLDDLQPGMAVSVSGR